MFAVVEGVHTDVYVVDRVRATEDGIGGAHYGGINRLVISRRCNLRRHVIAVIGNY